MTAFDDEIAATQRWFDSPRFAGITRLYSRAPGGGAARHASRTTTRWPATRRSLPRAPARALRRGQEHHHLRPLLARAGGGDEAHRHRGDLLGGWATSRQGLGRRGSGAGPRELSAQPGARRGARPSCARCSPPIATSTICPLAHDRGAARGDARRSTSARSSSPTPTPATAATRTCAT